MPKTMRWAI